MFTIIRSVIPKINWVRLKSPVFTTNFVKSHEKSHETKNTSRYGPGPGALLKLLKQLLYLGAGFDSFCW